uniref:Pentatricopeptide repeat-containing protein n=1 Tax=Solanum tuberosum TaxID=4113 RepID=M1CLK8_SOLTU
MKCSNDVVLAGNLNFFSGITSADRTFTIWSS